ncbi:uncharacterized [Tachysurus ichikawai]
MGLAGRRVKHSPYNAPVRALKLESRHVVENCIALYQAITAGLQQLDLEAFSDNSLFFSWHAINPTGMAVAAGMGMGGQRLGCYRVLYSAGLSASLSLEYPPEYSKALQTDTKPNPIYRPSGQTRALAPSQIPARASGGRSVDLGVYASNLNHASTEIAMGEQRRLRVHSEMMNR